MEKLSKRDNVKLAQSLDVIIEPMDPIIQHAVQKIKQIDPYVFKNVTKIIVHSGGGGGQLGHVEKGPNKDPHEIHIFKDRIKDLVTKQYRNINDPKAIQDAITLAIVEVIGHEVGHIGKFVNTPFLGEGEAEVRGKELAQKAKPLFANKSYLIASLALDSVRKRVNPKLPMSEPTLSFMIKAVNKDFKGIVKEGLEILNSDIVLPAINDIEDAMQYNERASKYFKVLKVFGIIQEKVGNNDPTSKDFIVSLANLQYWMGLNPTGKLDKNTISKFSQPNKNLPRNFAVVAPGIYRGGVIENEKQLKVLKELFGIERVISLNENKDIANMCKRVGLEHKMMPLEDGSSDEEGRLLFNDNVAKILEQKPTYIHCFFGQDRTGGVIARYRTEKGWPGKLAYLEAKAFGFQDKFPNLIEWFCEPSSDKLPVDTQKIREELSKIQKSDDFNINPTPTDMPFSNPFIPSEEHNYLIWSDTINNINPSMSINGVSAIAKDNSFKLKNTQNLYLSVRDKKAYINEIDKEKEIEEEMGEDKEEIINFISGINGLRGDVKPEQPIGGFSVEPYFAEKGEPSY